MKPNITQTACQSEVLRMPEENNSCVSVLEFDRDQVLNRYWELAKLDSEVTKGNITGQLKALDALREELAEKPKNDAKRIPSQQIYRSEWMDES
jgi:hypothetical protein